MNNKICKFYEDATIFDSDFNEIEYKYCNLFDNECKKTIKTKYCPYNLNKKLNSCKGKLDSYKQALEEIREDLEQDTTCESRECGCDDYGECLKCVKETILAIISEVLK